MVNTQIQRSFERSAYTYDHTSTIQKCAADTLTDMLLEQADSYTVAADFACGTGISTEFMLNKIMVKKLFAIDFSEALLEKARLKLRQPCVRFILSDFDGLKLPPSYLDLILSNMGLHWSPDFLQTLKNTALLLREYGILAFSIPVENTFQELEKNYRHCFYSKHEVLSLLKLVGYKVVNFKEFKYVQLFSSQFEAIRSIKNVGANQLLQLRSKDKGLLTKRKVKQYFVNPALTELTYHLGFFLAKKHEQ